MPKFNRQFIGYEYPNETTLKQNVYYKYNKLGHRCKNVEEINLDDYILFAGCSHTLGEALTLEYTFPYVTSKNLNCDYYNLAVPATGIDVVFYNLMMWFALYKPPKMVVLQYPDYARFSCSVPNSPLVVPHGPWESDIDIIDMMMKSEDKGLYSFRNTCYLQLLNNIIKVPLIKIVFGQTKSIDSDAIRIHKVDYAVDNQHYGPETHSIVADILCDKYKNAAIHSTFRGKSE